MKQAVTKYIKIYFLFFKNSVALLASHRFNLIMSAVANIVWTITQVIALQFLFQKVDSFAGWSINDMILLLGFGQLFVYSMFIFYSDNHAEIQAKIVMGELDMYLTKPINLKFFLSFATVSIAQIMPFFVAVIPLLIIGLRDMRALSLIDIIFCLVVFITGMVIMFLLSLTMAALNFFTDDASAVRDFFMNSMDLNRIPLSFLPNAAQLFFIFIVPVAFITYYPVLILKEPQNMVFILGAEVITLLFFLILSKLLWSIGLKKYSGAA